MSRIQRVLPWLRAHWEGVLAGVLTIASAIVLFKLARHIDRQIVDDAGISIGFGRSFAFGRGFRATPYSQAVEGFSNPTWTLVLGLLERLGFNTIATAKTLGICLTALAMPLFVLWGPASQDRKIQVEDALGPLLYCTNASLVYWALGGLESGLIVFLIALYVLLLFAPRTRRRAIGLGLAAAALALTRPEGPMYVGLGLVPWALAGVIDKRLRFRPTRLDGIALVSFLAPFLLYVLFRRLYFGAWLPNTYYAKQSWMIGLDVSTAVESYLKRFYETSSLVYQLCAVGIVVSLAGGFRTTKTAIASASIAGAMFYFTWYAQGDWMKEWRFLAPAVPFVCYPIAAGASGLRRLLSRAWFTERKLLGAGLHALVGVGLVYALVQSTKKHETRWAEVKAAGSDVPLDPALRATYGKGIRDLTVPFAMTHPLVAGPDLGWVSIGMRDSEIMDLAGLADATIARHYGNPRALNDYLHKEGLPSVLMIWGPAGWLWNMSDVTQSYTPSPSSAWCLVYKATPDADDRCPSGKASALAADPEQMVKTVLDDLHAKDAVRALASWRCFVTYREDAALPSLSRRSDMAQEAKAAARAAESAGEAEPALRAYSLCAVVGLRTGDGPSCRLRAERLRAQLFPRPAQPAKAKKKK